ncbi:MAG: hypothetical protein NTZ94_14315 [Verrucomicrobia bacterium]|nr:hypothetical protein [Verrucomicrobiota bacterium]
MSNPLINRLANGSSGAVAGGSLRPSISSTLGGRHAVDLARSRTALRKE